MRVDGLSENRFLGAFFLWRLSLAAFSISFESQSRSDYIQISVSEQRSQSALHWALQATLFPFLSVLLKTVASWVVHPVAALPALTSRIRHLSALSASKTASHPQFTRMPLQLQVLVWVAILKSFSCHFLSVSVCPVPSMGVFYTPGTQNPGGTLLHTSKPTTKILFL